MQVPHRAFFRVARVIAPDPGRVGRHGPHLAFNSAGFFPQRDGVVVGLGHFLPVRTGHFRRFGQQRPGFREDHLAAAFQVSYQALAVADADILLCFHQRPGSFQCLYVALLLVLFQQVEIELIVLLAHFSGRLLGLFFKPGIAPVQVIETPRHLARHLDVGNLVLSDRYETCLEYDDIGSLQQRITQETVGGQVPAMQPLLLLLVGRYSLQPALRGDHGQQQVQFRVFGDT